MKITIKELRMQNFKCFRDKTITFSPHVTTISGRNGSGKTTIADAILFCLFGKNTMGATQFDLKTHGEDGQPIPNLDHSVELILLADGVERSLKRTVKETWVKKRGQDELVFKNNTTEYLTDGSVVTAKEYQQVISSLIDEEVFRAVTSPTYFTSKHWKDQRAFLSSLVGAQTVTIEDETLREALTQMSLEAYRKSLSTRIKQIREKLEKIPTRLEEQKKALPEQLDWDKLNEELTQVVSEIDSVERIIQQLKSGDSSEVRRAELKASLTKTATRMMVFENDARESVRKEQYERDNKIAELRNQFRQCSDNITGYQTLLTKHDAMKQRCEETLKQCDEDVLEIRKLWAENQASTLQLSDNDAVCPTCHQPLPDFMLKEKLEEMRRLFNETKAEKKKQLTERAEKVKKLIADTKEELERESAEREKTVISLEQEKERQIAIQRSKTEIEQTPIQTVEQYLAQNEDYAALQIQEQKLRSELENIGVTSDEDKQRLLDEEQKKQDLFDRRRNLIEQLASKQQYERIQELITGIYTEEKELISQLSDLERKEDVARTYERRQNEMLEEEINGRFELVKWRMFRTVNNGGEPFDEPYCECYVDNVAYHDGLNQAAQLNAGIDICRTLSHHYGFYAPILIDNAESINNIIETESQQVRFYVSEDNELTIKLN